MKKRLFSILLCIVVCMAMMPLGVYGAKYTITVGGEQISINTDEQEVYDLTENITTKAGGYVKYNGKTYITVVLGAPYDYWRWEDTKQLIGYIKKYM